MTERMMVFLMSVLVLIGFVVLAVLGLKDEAGGLLGGYCGMLFIYWFGKGMM